MKRKTTAFAIGATLALGIVHNTPDAIQYIFCESQGTSANCQARNLAGLVRSCSTANPAFLAAIHSIGTDSFLLFRWNAAGQCTSVSVRNGSLTVPKV